MPPRRATRRTDTPAKRLVRRLMWLVGIVVVLVFAVDGGEYGTIDVIRQQSRMHALDGEVARLRAEVDSLRHEFAAVANDTVRLERIAREDFGMVRGDKELVYLARAPRSSIDSNPARDSSPTNPPRG